MLVPVHVHVHVHVYATTCTCLYMTTRYGEWEGQESGRAGVRDMWHSQWVPIPQEVSLPKHAPHRVAHERQQVCCQSVVVTHACVKSTPVHLYLYMYIPAHILVYMYLYMYKNIV